MTCRECPPPWGPRFNAGGTPALPLPSVASVKSVVQSPQSRRRRGRGRHDRSPTHGKIFCLHSDSMLGKSYLAQYLQCGSATVPWERDDAIGRITKGNDRRAAKAAGSPAGLRAIFKIRIDESRLVRMRPFETEERLISRGQHRQPRLGSKKRPWPALALSIDVISLRKAVSPGAQSVSKRPKLSHSTVQGGARASRPPEMRRAASETRPDARAPRLQRHFQMPTL